MRSISPAEPVRDGTFLFIPLRAVLGLLFFLSGAIGLIYEGAWQREFTLLFGSAAPATSIVLAAYFAGLGTGAFLVGKFSSRVRRPLLAYSVLELIIAAGALLVSPVLSMYARFYPELFARFHGLGSFLWIKGILAFISIALPTMAMGGTLPILARIFEGERRFFGRAVAWLYAVNTIGAAVGVLVFPMLLPILGLRNTTWFCVFGNVLIAFAGFLLSKRSSPTVQELGSKVAPTSDLTVRFAYTLAFLSGVITFVVQVGWNRAFAQVHENSIHSFAIIVALFIAAVALGSQVARMFLKRQVHWKRAIGICWIAAGALLVIAPQLFVASTGGLRFYPARGEMLPGGLLLPLLLVAAPVLLISVSLPLALHALATSSIRGLGDLTGRTLGLNIAGSVIGALLAGFLLPRYLGLWNSFILCGTATVTGGICALARSTGLRVAGFIAVAFVGSTLSRMDLPRVRVESGREEKMIFLREGAHGVVAVIDRGGEKSTTRRLKLNNHYVLGGTSATGDERLQGHIPLLIHPQPNSVAFLGYGTGITAGSVLFHPSTNAVALELVPEVVEVARDYFFDRAFSEKYPVLVEDARNYLRGTSNRFDLLVGDLVVPWRPGEGALYTFEHFRAARDRLTDSGLYACWLPVFQLDSEGFEMILRTFLAVFPYIQVWRGDFSPTSPALALIGSAERVVPQNVRLGRMMPDPANPHLKFDSAFWMHFVGVVTNMPAGDLNDENRPVIELRSAPTRLFVGRSLAEWEKELRLRSVHLEKFLTPNQVAGWKAGELMREFTLLLSEGKRTEADGLAHRIQALLGEEVTRTVLGP